MSGAFQSTQCKKLGSLLNCERLLERLLKVFDESLSIKTSSNCLLFILVKSLNLLLLFKDSLDSEQTTSFLEALFKSTDGSRGPRVLVLLGFNLLMWSISF